MLILMANAQAFAESFLVTEVQIKSDLQSIRFTLLYGLWRFVVSVCYKKYSRRENRVCLLSFCETLRLKNVQPIQERM
ncbi:Uncharacterized protein BN1090_A2_04639 [Aneurinibacillus migulanus]|nr:Uncharacterized protein BN1090_A2_04639 [Aneurinibacillus migulanus]